MKTNPKERIVENEVTDFYDIRINTIGEKGSIALDIEPQPSLNSGKGTKVFPEFFITHPDYEDVLLVVEAKKLAKDHVYKKEGSSALREVHEYKELVKLDPTLDKYKHLVTLAISDLKDHQLITLELANRHTSAKIIKEEMLTFKEIVEFINMDEKLNQKKEKNLIKIANKIKDDLQTKTYLVQNKVPLFIASLMVALKEDKFSHKFYNFAEPADFDILKNMILAETDIFFGTTTRDRFQTILSDSGLKNKHSDGHSLLYYLITRLKTLLTNSEYIFNSQDILGLFYHVFFNDEKSGDTKGQGIVLTPDPIKELMVRLSEINLDSVVYDPCTGTGGFLMASAERMRVLAREEKYDLDLSKRLYGCEKDDIMYLLTQTNLLFKEIGRMNIHKGSCFNRDRKDYAASDILFTAGILNPPYAENARETGLEMKFIKHTLDMVQKGSKVSTIIPKTVIENLGDLPAKDRYDLLENNRVDSIIILKQGVFGSAAPGVRPIVITMTAGIKHPPLYKTRIVDYSQKTLATTEDVEDIIRLLDTSGDNSTVHGEVILYGKPTWTIKDLLKTRESFDGKYDYIEEKIFKDSLRTDSIYNSAKKILDMVDITDIYFERKSD